MPFDQPTRNRLARFVGDARTLLTSEFTRQLQHEYGLDPTNGEITEIVRLTALDDARRESARLLRATLAHYLSGQAGNPNAKARQGALERLVREQAFTVLNRLCALRMAESRGLLLESIARGYQSKGFQLYVRLAGTSLGETGDTYRAYLFSLFDEFAVDLPVLFDRFNAQGRLFPRPAVLLQLLDLIDHPELVDLWAEDETIGWIYQYFNSKEERKAMRDASQAPRNSRELAVRNQFFTPRYVVQFLTDNTLGRIWYEMTQGRTSLVGSCRYLVRRPNEIFLAKGETLPEDKATGFAPNGLPSSAERRQEEQELSQEELLRQPVYIPFRRLKDPRTILMLDPACGSMHFGLYSFDLYERIYEEAWELEGELGAQVFQRPATMAPLQKCYPDKQSFLRDVPRLIIEHNIHGIDIDPRAVQIAGLSLWLRAQKSWQAQGVKPQERPMIRKSNIVCAEPMPGDKALLEEFLKNLRDERLESLIRRVLDVPEDQRVRATPTMADALCDLVRAVWEEMKLAGEAGSLLKIEEALTEAIAKGRAEWEEKMPLFRVETFRMTEEKPKVNYVKVIPGEEADFWDRAEALVLAALVEYANQIEDGGGYQRRLFAEDAAQGFAFIDLCRRLYDVILMNPPFGEPMSSSKEYLFSRYPDAKYDLNVTFAERASILLNNKGRYGQLSNRVIFYGKMTANWRSKEFTKADSLYLFGDLGIGVLDDAMVEAVAFVSSLESAFAESLFFKALDTGTTLLQQVEALLHGIINQGCYLLDLQLLRTLPDFPIAYWIPKLWFVPFKKFRTLADYGIVVKQGMSSSDNFRFVRLWWETRVDSGKWHPYAKGGGFGPQWNDADVVINWSHQGQEIKSYSASLYGTWAKQITNTHLYGSRGLTYPASRVEFSPRVLAEGSVLGNSGPIIRFIEEHQNTRQNLLSLLAILSSSSFRALLNLTTSSGDTMSKSYREGAVALMPIPNPETISSENRQLLTQIINLLYEVESAQETTHQFTVCRPIVDIENIFNRIREYRYRLDQNICGHYGFTGPEYIAQLERGFDDGIDHIDNTDTTMVPYSIGCVVGRWDIWYATGKKVVLQRSDPFAYLPDCPPGMLQNAQGIPALPTDVPADYPLRISWLGILVDDPGHPEDIEGRVREVLRIIWPDSADAIEQEACEILGVASLRAYFASPSRFFDDHLKRYTKSRRAAPIYWPLSTPSGSYTLWLYYHRLTDQTLYSCVNDFVEPKLKQVNDDVATLRRRDNRSRQEEKELERLSDLALELAAFRDELLRIARFWQPNLNDGVQITAAPLWPLFQHRPWQKRLKETWEALEAGDYDWAHLAYSIWPDRVAAKCKTDKSLAIAHDLEHLYQVPPLASKNKGGAKKKITAQQEELFDDD